MSYRGRLWYNEQVMGNPIISIVIPVYNAAPYIERSLGSVLAQTYRELEIIVVDDGSTDATPEILRRFASSDDRIKVITKENGGSSSARNAGLKQATGEYLGFIDADDYIEPDMYENLLGVFESDDTVQAAQILSCEEDEEGRIIKDFGEGFDPAEDFTGREFFRALLLHKGDSSFCTKLFRRDFFEGFSFSEGRLNEDFELLVSMSVRIDHLRVCRKPGYHIILRSVSNTRGDYKQSFYENVMENADKMIGMTEASYPDLKDAAIHFYLIQAMWLLLHIPAEKMTKDNALYTRVIRRVKSSKGFILRDSELPKNYKRNLLIFAFFPPRAVKKLYGALKNR